MDDALANLGAQLAGRYRSARPFPHIAIQNFWNEAALGAVADEVKGFDFYDGEKDFYGARKKRFCSTYDKLPPKTRALVDRCNAPEFIGFLETLTGETGLVADPYLMGGGIHSSLAGGFLKVHADFNWHARLKMYRRLNLLIYLNRDWDRQWGGSLELWSRDMERCEVSIAPDFGAMVVFSTDDTSFHGHPEPMTCPVGVSRDSIALYYYSPPREGEDSRGVRQDTDYRRRRVGD